MLYFYLWWFELASISIVINIDFFFFISAGFLEDIALTEDDYQIEMEIARQRLAHYTHRGSKRPTEMGHVDSINQLVSEGSNHRTTARSSSTHKHSINSQYSKTLSARHWLRHKKRHRSRDRQQLRQERRERRRRLRRLRR